MNTIYHVKPLEGYPPEIGAWLWAMEETRLRTKELIQGVSQSVLDWDNNGSENSIGSLLYHIAIVELSWLYLDILEQPLPDGEFPFPMATDGRITSVKNVPLEKHLQRLDWARETFLDEFRKITISDWSRLRNPSGASYCVSPAWAVFHLVEHEAIHSGQMATKLNRAVSELGDDR